MDPSGAGVNLGTGHGKDAVAQVRGDLLGIDRMRKMKGAAERAVTALDAVILLTGCVAVAPHAGDREVVVMELDLQVVLLEARHFRNEYVLFGGFVQIDGR